MNRSKKKTSGCKPAILFSSRETDNCPVAETEGWKPYDITLENARDFLKAQEEDSRRIQKEMIASYINGEEPYLGGGDDPLFGQGELILQVIVRILKAGEELPETARTFLINSLESILQGDDIKEALKLKKHRGRQGSGFLDFRDALLHFFVCELKKGGMSNEEAYAEVALALDPDNDNIPDAMVEKAYKRIKKQSDFSPR